MISFRLFALAFIAPLLLGANDPPAPSDYLADARSLESLIDRNYAYLDRFDDLRAPISERLRAEAETVHDRATLLRYTERVLSALADHHATTGSSLADSWGLVPSYSDLWVERRGADYVITAVREGSLAQQANVAVGDRLIAVEAVPTALAVEQFWTDLGLPVTAERADYAARVLAAGRRNAPRDLTLARGNSAPRQLVLPNLYTTPPAERSPLTTSAEGRSLVIRFNNSLGDSATVEAFDAAMAKAGPGQPVVLDLTDTPSGGNTSVARGIMGWFVTKPTSYQLHTLPSEERETGLARQWLEQVLPRAGKYHRGPVVVRVGRWTGSMGEGLAVGFDTIGARVEGGPMAGLLGAVYDYTLEQSGLTFKLPSERLYHVNGTPREKYVPASPRR
ncbi:peptidase S41 [Altererythrobacter sp. Root672]|uniref:peptidase S41 n=1 Tax=Altererythrobacter sp. Root672 TaxID=1736584 RepID=UPI0012E32EB0|nr:peptidase S41 [Altererythrobacter sp. Root672]